MDTPKKQELVALKPQELTRQATDIAGLCKEIVLKTALEIQGRKYVRVEGWQSIATAHGCISGSRDVEAVRDPAGVVIGYKAIGEIKNITTGHVIGQAEGYVGSDETTWFGGTVQTWDKVKRAYVSKEVRKRPDYAIRAMCQTRAISRACRAAFAHVVVLMDQNLDTTPAEEVDENSEAVEFFDKQQERQEREAAIPVEAASVVPCRTAGQTNPAERQPDADWRSVVVPFGKNKGTPLGALSDKSLLWYCENYAVQTEYEKDGKTVQCSEKSIEEQKAFRAALDAAAAEMMQAE